MPRDDLAGDFARLNLDLAGACADIGPVTSPDLYKPLPQGHIRLVRVHVLSRMSRRAKFEPFHEASTFALQIYSLPINARNLKRSDGYIALSHHWGLSRSTSVGYIYGENNRQTRTPIRGSLHEAISRLCDFLDLDWFDLWVDQLCIDQSSQLEKGTQVGLMRDIYENARRVICWLGTKTRSSDAAIATLHFVYRQLATVQDIVKETTADSLMSFAHTPSLQDSGTWDDVTELFERGWFSRAWVYQEVSAVEDTILLCGDQTIKFGVASRAALTLNEIRLSQPYRNHPGARRYSERSIRSMEIFARDRKEFKALPLLDLVEQIRCADASDPRDKIFCVLSFASVSGAPDLMSILDYRKSVTRIFCEFVARHICQYGDIKFLSHAEPHYVTDPDHPSWVPDWAYRGSSHLCDYVTPDLVAGPHVIYRASGEFTNRVVLTDIQPLYPKMLVIEGIRIGIVGTVIENKPLAAIEECTNRNWQSGTNSKCRLNRVPWRQVYDRTVVFDVYGNEDDEYWRRALPGSAREQKRKAYALERAEWSKIFFTEPAEPGGSRLMGIGTARVDPGYEIWMLKGGEVLYFLKPTRSRYDQRFTTLDLTGVPSQDLRLRKRDPCHSYVGECFIYGLMGGELLDMMGEHPQRRKPSCLQDMDTNFRRVFII